MISTVINPFFSCAFRSLFASRQQSKPMNFGADGIHRMFQLHKHRPREDSGVRNQACLQARAVALCHMAKETPARGKTKFAQRSLGGHELVSAIEDRNPCLPP